MIAFDRSATSRVVNENPSHGRRGDAIEVGAIFPRDLPPAHQAEIGVVDELSGGDDRSARPFASKVRGRIRSASGAEARAAAALSSSS